MKPKFLLCLVGAVLLLSACIPSVHPFYTEKDVIFDARLVGRWGRADEPAESWQFEVATNKTYKLTVTEKEGKHGEFEAHLFKLGGQTFLDLGPAEVELKEDQVGLVAVTLIRGHLLLRVREIGPGLKLDFCNMSWLKKYLETHPESLRHRAGKGDDFVLTADPEELQRFVLAHLKEGELFEASKDNEGMVRLADAPKGK